jgi:hypothetical protein
MSIERPLDFRDQSLSGRAMPTRNAASNSNYEILPIILEKYKKSVAARSHMQRGRLSPNAILRKANPSHRLGSRSENILIILNKQNIFHN